MQFLGTIKKWQVRIRVSKTQNSGKPHKSAQNRVESKRSCIFQELMNRGTYAYVVV